MAKALEAQGIKVAADVVITVRIHATVTLQAVESAAAERGNQRGNRAGKHGVTLHARLSTDQRTIHCLIRRGPPFCPA